MLRRFAVHFVVLSIVVTLAAAGTARPALASPVATDDATYFTYGRVFPDPHGCVKGQPLKSPYAKGNVCAAQFIQYSELVKGLTYLNTKFPEFMEIFEVPGLSAGLPVTTLQRDSSKLYAVRVTDERVGGAKKKFAISLSIHGIERAGAEGGTRAIEDLVTWARNEPGRGLLEDTLGRGASAITVGDALKRSEIWFYWPNPDGWRRGDVTAGGVAYQRYNGNGVDPNRDWPTKGFTYRPYTPASEPETKAFSSFLKAKATGAIGTADLHGMLNANAFTFTMLPAGEIDYARNKAVVAVSRRIQQDSTPRLSWFVGVTPNGSRSIPDVAQQWGTVWDTIAYTTTGSLGDWMGSPLGLDAYVAIDNEMWMSHLGPNNAFVPDLEQAHIDGNKGLIYAQIEGAFRDAGRTFPLTGARVAYVDHGRRFTHPGSAVTPNPYAGMPRQPDATATVVSPAADASVNPTYEFDILGPIDGIYNGGLTVNVTYTNVQGASPADLLTGVYVDRYTKDDEGGPRWEVVNSHWNQNQAYAAAGHTVNVNAPIAGHYRVRFDTAPPGIHRIDLHYSSGLSWPDPGQLAYDVSSIKFLEDLKQYLPASSTLTGVTPDAILAGADLSGYDSVIVVNDPLPGAYDAIGGAGSAQPTQTFSVIAPVPSAGTATPADAIYEFDVLPQFNNQSMSVATRWDVLSDYDLFVERQSSAGGWVQVGSATNGLNKGETATMSGFFAGHYRARINNWAGAPQQISGVISFSTTPGQLPPQYPTTRTPAQADAYYAKLMAYATGGGNLVLTDGAARALPHLGVGATTDVKPVVVYAPYIEFNNGGRPTYDDPLAAGVNQPGAAEGPSNRHQMVEPVPLGYAIQDTSGANASTSFTWAIARNAWTAAGGRIAGTISDQVALGELSRGKGKIRFVGALLPDPSEQYDHPYGLSNYAVTWSGWQVFEDIVQWHRPLPDLAVSASDITLSPSTVVAGDQVSITAKVRNIGTADAANVTVRLTDNGTVVGADQTIAAIAAGGSGTVSAVWNTRGLRGDHTITVTADPANAIRELNESNNAASVVVRVRQNEVQNGQFEDSATGAQPDHWTPSGETRYEPSSPDGGRSVSTGPSGTWTSDPVTVTPGTAYGLTVQTAGGRIVVEQLSAVGTLLVTTTLTQAVGGFTAGAGVAQVRVKLAGGLSGTSTFDDVRLWVE
jgi:hypothetical protein